MRKTNKKNSRKSFSRLKKNIGKRVKVEYVWYGTPLKEEGTLKRVEDYVIIQVNGVLIPFIGYGSAIQRIMNENGNVIYENPMIPYNYNLRDFEEIEELKAKCFGEEIVEKFRKEKLKAEKRWQRRVKKLNKKAKKTLKNILKRVWPW